jgi:hypothetical protein
MDEILLFCYYLIKWIRIRFKWLPGYFCFYEKNHSMKTKRGILTILKSNLHQETFAAKIAI